MTVSIYQGDCLEVMDLLPSKSVDAVVTDPPYGLSFMGKRWDYDVPGVEVWRECLRVLKPGGYLLAFAGTRTQHRMCVNIEDAGFEIRDMIAWLYGSGFPKSHNGPWGGTALKPAMEPITVARKPLIGTVAENWAQYETGALGIDGCRVPGEPDAPGRWPANVAHDGSDEVLAAFPDAPGQLADASFSSRKTQNVYGAMRRGRSGEPSAQSDNEGAVGFKMKPGARRFDNGSAARFFYCAKASRQDRNEGLEHFTPKTTDDGRQTSIDNPFLRGETERANSHPTVKPTDLMRWLVRLVAQPGGVVLDPFAGSGSTGKACALEGRRFVGIEREPDYVAIAQARIAAATASQPTSLPT